ncbi:MAG: SGNH/GDSL hydrolase family protein [Hyphomicrobiaceae bacterium]
MPLAPLLPTLICLGLALPVVTAAGASSYKTTDILVIGDSQLSFGAGPVLETFFRTLPQQCARITNPSAEPDTLTGLSFAMIGARSTSLQSWVTRRTPAWRQLCRKDKTHGVNASTWGTLAQPKMRYVQIGEGARFQFCKRRHTPLQALTSTGGYRPKVIIWFLGGNGAGRLAGSTKSTRSDVDRLVTQLRSDVGCVVMTTVPVYSRRLNRTRLKAQANLKAALAAHGRRCSFVAGFTPATIKLVQGQARYFRRRRSGTVKDPFHPSEAATRKVFALMKPQLCRALVEQLDRTSPKAARAR